ncbi:uncharacterized protein LOC127257691 [Andrographis paniculata]|uniref:uncharacterized protein LOC127257691 n=1 Tax=Andrographis paniculata TaxID=175694 RepID=UPI0021E6F816|nr:uncharacterized protein LOC127257691 [Andrographis paniculata]
MMAAEASGDPRNNSSSSSSSSSSGAKSKNLLKKGPWTTAEDMILVEYVKRHGEGNWNAVQRNSGLMRCGKSCRLRWANHLRPNLKKGAFSIEEENLIVELHAKLGNKWARMAAQLPGRTDNEIKNYWNTRLKRRQRAGLPIYPEEVVPQQQALMNSSSPLLSSGSPNPIPLPFNSPQMKNYPTASDWTPFLKQCVAEDPILPMNPFPEYNISPLKYGLAGMPSSELAAATSSEVELGFQRTGLLGDLFCEYKALSRRRKPLINAAAVGKYDGHQNGGVCSVNEKENGSASEDCRGDELGKAKSCGDGMEDELLSQLLDNFPLSVPIPEWNDGQESVMVNGTSGTMQSSQPVADDASSSRYKSETTAAAESTSTSTININASCLWNNMPIIY